METTSSGHLRRTRRDPESIAVSANMQRRDTLSETLFWMKLRRHSREAVAEFKAAFNHAKEEWPDDEWVRHSGWSIENLRLKLVDEYRNRGNAKNENLPKPKRRRRRVQNASKPRVGTAFTRVDT